MEVITLQVKKDLKEKLEKEAKELGITLSGYIRMILISRKGR